MLAQYKPMEQPVFLDQSHHLKQKSYGITWKNKNEVPYYHKKYYKAKFRSSEIIFNIFHLD